MGTRELLQVSSREIIIPVFQNGKWNNVVDGEKILDTKRPEADNYSQPGKRLGGSVHKQ